MDMPFVRSPYNYDRDKASNESGLACKDKTRAKQEFAEECDINVIAKRFGLSGQLPSNVPYVMQGDFTEALDFRESMELLIAAERAFMQMPADVRSRFGNSPEAFVEFCSHEENLPEMRKLGLAVPEVKASGVAAPAAAPVAAPGAPGAT